MRIFPRGSRFSLRIYKLFIGLNGTKTWENRRKNELRMLGSYCYESIREKTVRSKKFAFTPIDCFLINAFSKEEKCRG